MVEIYRFTVCTRETTEVVVNKAMDQLPDNLLLEIFRFLPVKDRCIVGRTCRRFRRITCDNSLWREVDLLPYRLNVRKTWKVIRSHLSECLLTFKIRGFLGITGKKSKEMAVTNAMLEDPRDRCPNINYFHLQSVNIDTLDAAKLPKTITKLVIQECTWPLGWLKNAELPNLRYLDLKNTRIMDTARVDEIINFANLEEISFENCYRINDKAIKLLVENLPNLKCLNLSKTSITELGLHHLCRALAGLVKLNLDDTKIEDSSLEMIAACLKSLEELSVCDCKVLSTNGYQHIQKMKNLKMLLLTCNIDESILEEINIVLPHCKIVKYTTHLKVLKDRQTEI